MKNTSIRAFANNKCKIADLAFPMSQITETNVFVVTKVAVQKKYVDGKPTDEVEGVSYVLTDTKTYTQIRIKSLETVPVITQEELNASETPVFVEIPIEKVLIKPYRIEFGVVSISLVSPYVTLLETTDLIDIDTL